MISARKPLVLGKDQSELFRNPDTCALRQNCGRKQNVGRTTVPCSFSNRWITVRRPRPITIQKPDTKTIFVSVNQMSLAQAELESFRHGRPGHLRKCTPSPSLPLSSPLIGCQISWVIFRLFGNVALIISNNSRLSAGFCKNADAPADSVFSLLYKGSRALSTITGMLDRGALS
jgi:hypothetical protein